MRACWSRMLAKVAEQHTIWPPLGHSDTALARSMTGPVYSLLLVISCTCRTQHADTPPQNTEEKTEEKTAMPGAIEMLLRSLGLTSGQSCKSGTCCVSRGRQLGWCCNKLHEEQGIHAQYRNLHLDFLNYAGANAHSDAKASEQNLRCCQVDCTLCAVHYFGRGPDGRAMVANELCRPGCSQQCLLGSPAVPCR